MPQRTLATSLTKEEVATRLKEGYRVVKVPSVDMYDKPFVGFWINDLEFRPGSHIVSEELAGEMERILAAWQTQMIRLLRPTPHRRSLEEANRGASPSISGGKATSGDVIDHLIEVEEAKGKEVLR